MNAKELIVDIFNNKISTLGLKQKNIAERIGVTEDVCQEFCREKAICLLKRWLSYALFST